MAAPVSAPPLVQRVLSRRAQEVGHGFPKQTSVPTPGLLTLSSGTPDFPTPPHVIAAAKQALDQGRTVYTPWAGLMDLRRGIAAKLARENGITADPETEVLVTTGAQEAMLITLQTLLDPGDEILIHTPYYDEYRRDTLIAGGTLVTVPTYEADNFAINVREVEKRLTPRTKALIVVSPSNPTGAVQPRSSLEAIAQLAQERDLLVISDELYERFVYDDNRHLSLASLPGMWERTITINGFSKCYSMTGWRVGYIAAPAPLIQAMLPFKHAMSICAPSVSQYAALAGITSPTDWFAPVLAEYDRRRGVWMKALDEMGLSYSKPQGAYYVYVNVSATGLTGAEFSKLLRDEYGVVLGSGSNLGEETKYYLRGSLATPMEELQPGLERVAEAVARCRAGR